MNDAFCVQAFFFSRVRTFPTRTAVLKLGEMRDVSVSKRSLVREEEVKSNRIIDNKLPEGKPHSGVNTRELMFH